MTQRQLVVQGNGPGSITASNFSANPTNVALPTGTGVFDNVALGHGSNFFSVEVAVCNEGAGNSLMWFNGTAWVPFSLQSTKDDCLFGLAGQEDSSPTLAQMASIPIGVSYLPSPTAPQGYWLTASDGGIFSFHRTFYGSTGSLHLNQPIVGMAATHDLGGYWLAASDGGIFAFGDAPFDGSLPYEGQHTSKVVAIVGDPANFGYLIIKSDGTVWDFGGVPSFGDLPLFGITVNNIVGGAMTPDGRGLYLVSATGKVYVLLGDGTFAGDASGIALNAPVIGMSVDPATGGYWLLAKDGGVFSYNAPFFGSTGNIRLNQPVVGMSSTADGGGYWFVAADGGVFSFGDARSMARPAASGSTSRWSGWRGPDRWCGLTSGLTSPAPGARSGSTASTPRWSSSSTPTRCRWCTAPSSSTRAHRPGGPRAWTRSWPASTA